MTKDEQDALETVTKASVDAALEPVKTALTNVASPFTEEIGKLLALPFKWWNFRASCFIMEKAKKFLDEKGIQSQQVPMKLLAPILEYGSLEDDESMQDRWARLLASAADHGKSGVIPPCFPAILKEISPVEATILDRIYGSIIMHGTNIPFGKDESGWCWNRYHVNILESFGDLSLTRDQLGVAFHNLSRLGLIDWVRRANQEVLIDFHPNMLGFAFISSCFVRKENLGMIKFKDHMTGAEISFDDPADLKYGAEYDLTIKP